MRTLEEVGFRHHPNLGLLVLPPRTSPVDAWLLISEAATRLAESGYRLACDPSVAEHLTGLTGRGATTLIPIPDRPDLEAFAHGLARRLPGNWTVTAHRLDREHRTLATLAHWSVGDGSRLHQALDQVTCDTAALLSGPCGLRLLAAPEPRRTDRFTVGPVAPSGLDGEHHWPTGYTAPHLSVPADPARAAHTVRSRALPAYQTAAQHSRFEILRAAAVGIHAIDAGSSHPYTPEPREAVLELLRHAPHFLDAAWHDPTTRQSAGVPWRLITARDALADLQAVEERRRPHTGTLPARLEEPSPARIARDEAGWQHAVQLARQIPNLTPAGDAPPATPQSAAARTLLRTLTPLPAPAAKPPGSPAVPRDPHGRHR